MSLVIYCDGACSNKVGGWAAVLLYGDRRHEMSGAEPITTNNRMEMTAAIKALEKIKKPFDVTINTDSQYLCNAFNKKWIKNWKRNGWKTKEGKDVLNKDLWEVLDKLAATHKITWNWVKGHSDNVENNRCDELAVQARIDFAKNSK